MNLHGLTEKTAYLEGAINLGILINKNQALLIDSGIDKSTARKAVKLLNERKLEITGLILTHSHADHIGGASFLRDTLQIPVMSSAVEKPFIENTRLEPFYLFGGAQALSAMENKFLQAPACPVDLCLENGKQDILSFSLDIRPLPGHSLGQIGVIYENTYFLADAVFSPLILEKHGLPYFADIESTFSTLDRLSATDECCRYFVPAHAPAIGDASSLVAANRDYLNNLLSLITITLSQPLTTGELLSLLCEKKGITVSNPSQFYLLQASLHSLLSYLSNRTTISYKFQDNLLYWVK